MTPAEIKVIQEYARRIKDGMLECVCQRALGATVLKTDIAMHRDQILRVTQMTEKQAMAALDISDQLQGVLDAFSDGMVRNDELSS